MLLAGQHRGGREAAAATLTLAEEDLLTLCADPAKARDLFQRGKLRVSGDMGPAHKLAFLKGHA